MNPELAQMAVILAVLYVAGNMCAWFQLIWPVALTYTAVTSALFLFWVLEALGVTNLV